MTIMFNSRQLKSADDLKKISRRGELPSGSAGIRGDNDAEWNWLRKNGLTNDSTQEINYRAIDLIFKEFPDYKITFNEAEPENVALWQPLYLIRFIENRNRS